MKFRNESTWLRFERRGRAQIFHTRYEIALTNIRASLDEEHYAYIGDERVQASETVEKTSPIDYRIGLGKIQKCTEEHAMYAVEEARKAFDNWSTMSYRKRAAIFQRAADLLSRKKFEVAAMESLETGKNRFEAMADVDAAIDHIRFYVAQLISNAGYRKRRRSPFGERVENSLRPRGVWAIMVSFSQPLAMAAGMAVAALITGNTVVLRPSSKACLTVLEFYKILRKAGLPGGALNVITGPCDVICNALVHDADVFGVAFSGRKDFGLELYRKFVEVRPRPFLAELGGKNPVIVTENADLSKAIEGTLKAAFSYGGQKPTAASRLIVHRKVKRKFVSKLAEAAKNLSIGDPTKREIFMGPIIDRKAVERFGRAREAAMQDGYIITGGEVLSGGIYDYGYYVQPTIVEGLPEGHWMYEEELFLPFLTVQTFRTLDEAIEIANSTEYGLSAGIFTEDEEEKKTLVSQLKAGMIYVNRREGATTGPAVGIRPLIGWKSSSTFTKGIGGEYFLTEFMKEQVITEC